MEKELKRSVIRIMLIALFVIIVVIAARYNSQSAGDDVTNSNNDDVISEFMEGYVSITYHVDEVVVHEQDVKKGSLGYMLYTPSLEEYHQFIGWEEADGDFFDKKRLYFDIDLYVRYEVDYQSLFNTVSTQTIRSSVKIIATHYNTGLFGIKTEEVKAVGSGVIFHDQHDNYYVLTNHHVITEDGYEHQTYDIEDYQGNTYSAVLYPGSARPDYDLAVLQFDKGGTELMSIDLAATNPEIGEEVIAIGNPQSQDNTITFGEVTAYHGVNNDGIDVAFDVIRHTAPVSSGSSGGALLNHDLALVGINFAASLSNDDDFSTSTVAIPIEKIRVYLTTYVYS